MKRPLILIIGAAAGALLVAAVGASAHSGFSLTSLVGVHNAVLTDDATNARGESPEPSESPEASESPESSPTAEPSEASDNDNEQGDNDDQGEDSTTKASPTSSGEHDDGEEHSTSSPGTGGHGDD
jgi:hypothetical protein